MKRSKKKVALTPYQLFFVAVIVIIALFLFFFLYPDKTVVGKAFYTEQMGTAGIEEPRASLVAQQPFSLLVKANSGSARTISIKFALDLPAPIRCENVRSIESELEWEEGENSALVSATAECRSNMISFEYSTLDVDESLMGEIEIARISFDGIPAGTYQFDFTEFEMLDVDERNSISTAVDTEIMVVGASTQTGNEGQQSGSSSGGSSGGGGGRRTSCTPQWTCLSWSSCEEGRQTRNCVDERRCGTTAQRPIVERNCIPQNISVAAGPEVVIPEPANSTIQQPVVVSPSESVWPKYILSIVIVLGIVAIALVFFGKNILLKKKTKH
ncbi:MAG: hypothetical protein Q7K45_01980 [Nanoarchaeota archaeon]|nr:hypothetical protein [Nanoarchaeota archaeon]